MSNIFALFADRFKARIEAGYGNRIVHVPPNALILDRVMENNPRESQSSLLQLPSELLAIILSHIDFESLPNLALVNSDCRQLARSRQFVTVRFDYSNSTRKLISLLLEEKRMRDQSNDALCGKRGAIGPCIRRLTIAVNSAWIKKLHNVDEATEFRELEEQERNSRIADARESLSRYLNDVDNLLSSRSTLPHFESLEWGVRLSPSQTFFNCLTTSSIQHLKLKPTIINNEFEVMQPNSTKKWNLRSLTMDLIWDRYSSGGREGSIVPLSTSLLRSCSHSLETLNLQQYVSGEFRNSPIHKYTFGLDPANIPRFEKLRSLSLQGIQFLEKTTLDALLEPPLSILDIRIIPDQLIAEALRDRGCMPSLETLILPGLGESVDHYITFLKENTHISKLSIEGDINGKWGTRLEDCILPILASCFRSLRSLRIQWDVAITRIPEKALELISKMDSLEQVSLGAGSRNPQRCSWLIDHEAMRKHLSKLSNLKRLAFERDSYLLKTIQSDGLRCEKYYMKCFPEVINEDDLSNSEDWERIWEDGHRRRMIVEVEKYAALMPKLEWIFIGQYPMSVEGACSGSRKAALICDNRSRCRILLNRMFWWDGWE